MENKTIAFFGCKKTTQFVIDSLSDIVKVNYLFTISPLKNEKIIIPDYIDLKKYYKNKNIDVYHVNRYDLKDSNDIKIISDLKIDLGFAIGWQRLIPEEVLNSINIGVFGMHGSSQDLPKGRGRSPMNWSIIEGREFFYTNLFKYDSGIDSGNILDTIKFSINKNDTAETMHFKNMISMSKLIKKNHSPLISEKFKLKKQRALKPTYYPKREPEDSQIDWDQEINFIDRFIRAVTKPFNGAFTFLNSQMFTIYSAQIFDEIEFLHKDFETGLILEILSDKKILVKCNGGVLLINSFESKVKPKKGDRFEIKYDKLKKFKKNNDGFYDLEK